MAKKKSKAKPPSLTPKQDMFVLEYLKDLNQTRAAIRAGYSPTSASVYAVELMANARVRAALDKAIEERKERTKATVDRVVEELMWLAYSRIEDYQKQDDPQNPIGVKPGVPTEAMRAVARVRTRVVQGVEGEPRLIDSEHWCHDKNKALALLSRHLGMFKEKIELEHDHRVTIYIPDNQRGGGK